MKRNRAGDRVLPVDWTEVIEKVQEVLTHVESDAAERERGLTATKSSRPSVKTRSAWKEGLERFEESLRLFQAKVQQAEDEATEADLALADGEKGLEDWLTRAKGISIKVTEASAGKSVAGGPTV